MVIFLSIKINAQKSLSSEELRLQAIAYYTGVGSNYDEEKAKELFQRASEKGDPLAQMWIARFYFNGQCGFSKNVEYAPQIAKSAFKNKTYEL